MIKENCFEEVSARLPHELFVKICKFLPSEVIFKLWCTGRELH